MAHMITELSEQEQIELAMRQSMHTKNEYEQFELAIKASMEDANKKAVSNAAKQSIIGTKRQEIYNANPYNKQMEFAKQQSIITQAEEEAQRNLAIKARMEDAKNKTLRNAANNQSRMNAVRSDNRRHTSYTKNMAIPKNSPRVRDSTDIKDMLLQDKWFDPRFYDELAKRELEKLNAIETETLTSKKKLAHATLI